MTLRPPTLERPAEAEGHDPPEVLFREARRRRRRRWAIGVATVVVASVAAIAFWATGASTPKSSSSSSGTTASIDNAWHAAGSRVFYRSLPAADSPGFTPSTDTITCAGTSSATCYVTIHADGVTPGGRVVTAGPPRYRDTLIASEFASTDAGLNWHRLTLPDKAWVSTAFDCSTPRDCAVGALVRVHGSGFLPDFVHPTAVVRTTQDGGRSWSLHHLPASAGLVRSVDCASSELCVVDTWTPTASEIDGMLTNFAPTPVFPTEVYVTRDGGKTWSSVRLPRLPAGDVYELTSLTCPSASRCLLTGERVHIEAATVHATPLHPSYVQRDAKTVVVSVDTRTLRATVQFRSSGPVSCTTTGHCLMARRTDPVSSGPTVFYASTNAGRSWSRVSEHDFGYNSSVLQCVSASSCITVTGAERTTDGGKRWTATGSNIREASCAPSGVCVGLQSDGIHDPYEPKAAAGYVWATRVVTNAPTRTAAAVHGGGT